MGFAKRWFALESAWPEKKFLTNGPANGCQLLIFLQMQELLTFHECAPSTEFLKTAAPQG